MALVGIRLASRASRHSLTGDSSPESDPLEGLHSMIIINSKIIQWSDLLPKQGNDGKSFMNPRRKDKIEIFYNIARM